MNSKIIITYGTFDLFHIGHLQLLKRCKELGGRLLVGVSTDEFNETKGKHTIIPYVERAEIVSAIRCVDEVFPEKSWDQKLSDIKKKNVDIFVMGDDWAGKFDFLKTNCNVVYLSRTQDISSSSIKKTLEVLQTVAQSRL